jgi:peroxiredoxin Q/BCP
MLKIDDPAPAFTLPSTTGKDLALSEMRGKKVVLYFYPKDDTPGCTKESCNFRDNMARLKGHGAAVLGVSRDTIASHAKFRAKYGLPFELLSDPDAQVGKAYGAFGKKMMYGKPVTGTIRSTFLIDEKGRIAAIWSPVRVEGHVDQVLAALGGGTAPKPAKADNARATAARSKRRTSARTPARKSSAPKAALPAQRKPTAATRTSSTRKRAAKR